MPVLVSSRIFYHKLKKRKKNISFVLVDMISIWYIYLNIIMTDKDMNNSKAFFYTVYCIVMLIWQILRYSNSWFSVISYNFIKINMISNYRYIYFFLHFLSKFYYFKNFRLKIILFIWEKVEPFALFTIMKFHIII